MFSRIPQSATPDTEPRAFVVPAVVYQARNLRNNLGAIAPASFAPHNFGGETPSKTPTAPSRYTPLDDII